MAGGVYREGWFYWGITHASNTTIKVAQAARARSHWPPMDCKSISGYPNGRAHSAPTLGSGAFVAVYHKQKSPRKCEGFLILLGVVSTHSNKTAHGVACKAHTSYPLYTLKLSSNKGASMRFRISIDRLRDFHI